ncbi:MAG: hypothetical protein ABH851_01340 [Methanobacteriota archaeon]
MGCSCCGYSQGCKFKLSILGVIFSMVLALSSILTGSIQTSITLPLSLVIAVVVLIPSLVLYYKVRDAFWREVEEKQNKKTN